MAQKKKTVKEIKKLFPLLTHKSTDGYHSVGYENGVRYIIKGTGSTANEAWQEAYEWLTRTGRYDPEVDQHYHKKSED